MGRLIVKWNERYKKRKYLNPPSWAHPSRPESPVLAQPQTEERAQNQWQRHQWFNRWGILHIWSEILEGHPTICSRSQSGHSSNLHCRWWGWECEGYRENWHQVDWTHQLTGKPLKVMSMTLNAPLINYYCRISFGLTIRTITSWGQKQIHSIYIRPYV